MIAKVSGLAKVGLSVAAGLLGLTVLMTVLAAAGSEAAREGESLAAYSEWLGASSVATLTVTAYPTSSIVPDGDAASTITATLFNEFGDVASDEDISVMFITTRGVLNSDTGTVTKSTTTGVATAELTSEEAGEAIIVANVDLISDWTQVTFSWGTPTTVTLDANRTSIVANGVSTLTITATVQDELGGPIFDGTVVTFTTQWGTLDSSNWVTTTTTAGEATAELTSDTTARSSCWITGCCDGECIWGFIKFIAGDPCTVTVVADPTSISIGGYTSTIEATVVDEYENLVDSVTVTFTNFLGTISPLTDTTSNGEAFTTLASGSTGGTATVTATADSKVENALVTFVPRTFLPLIMKSYTP